MVARQGAILLAPSTWGSYIFVYCNIRSTSNMVILFDLFKMRNSNATINKDVNPGILLEANMYCHLQNFKKLWVIFYMHKGNCTNMPHT